VGRLWVTAGLSVALSGLVPGFGLRAPAACAALRWLPLPAAACRRRAAAGCSARRRRRCPLPLPHVK